MKRISASLSAVSLIPNFTASSSPLSIHFERERLSVDLRVPNRGGSVGVGRFGFRRFPISVDADLARLSGVSVEFKVKTGPVTILGLTQTADGRLKLVGAEGESLPGPILRIGNTNSRLRFPSGPAEFINRWSMEGPTHHCALGVGHNLARIGKLASLLKIPLAEVK
jgi:hypothetical protein